MKALIAQLESVVRNPGANVGRAVAAITEHPDVDIAVFPELFLSAYDLRSLDRTALATEGDELAEICAAAGAAGTAVVIGFAERLDGRRFANSAACIDEGGTPVAVYRKTRLFGSEHKVFMPGDELCLVPLAGRLVAPLVCFDVEFPEPARALAIAGAELLVTVSANMEPYGDDHEVATRARALENHLPHLYANAIGAVDGHEFVGRSRSIGAGGDVLAAAGRTEELLVAPVGEQGPASEQVDYLKQLREPLPVVQQPLVGR